MVQSTAPLVTVAPTSADRPVTVPALCALIGCSIFIASRTTTRSPAETVAPSSTATLTIVPCIGEVSESPDAPEPPWPLPRLRGLAAEPAGAPAPPPAAATPAEQDEAEPRQTVVVEVGGIV